jgi:hypothetical protein
MDPMFSCCHPYIAAALTMFEGNPIIVACLLRAVAHDSVVAPMSDAEFWSNYVIQNVKAQLWCRLRLVQQAVAE